MTYRASWRNWENQLHEAERALILYTEKIVGDALAAGHKVTIIQDEIIIEENT